VEHTATTGERTWKSYGGFLDFDGLDGGHLNSSSVWTTLHWIYTIRIGIPRIAEEGQPPSVEGVAFAWLENTDHLAKSTGRLELWSNEHIRPLPSAIPKGLPPSAQPIASVTSNYGLPKNVSAVPGGTFFSQNPVLPAGSGI